MSRGIDVADFTIGVLVVHLFRSTLCAGLESRREKPSIADLNQSV
jgi:hypothetical protein